MNNIKSVCWDITSRCNDACRFCFRDSMSKDLSLNDNMLILEKYIKYGINKITFTGGEASLYNGLWELISYAKNQNIYTNLVTNAVSVDDDFIENIGKYLDCITMSLDGPDSIIQKNMTRNINHFNNVINVLKRIEAKGITIEKKINTLVTKINIDYIMSILPILYDYKINIWKLFQFISPRYEALLNQNLFAVSDSDFLKLKEGIKDVNRERIKIIFQNSNNLKNSYFVVSSNGNVRFDGNSKYFIGNLLTEDIDKIFDNLSRVNFNYSDYLERKICNCSTVA